MDENEAKRRVDRSRSKSRARGQKDARKRMSRSTFNAPELVNFESITVAQNHKKEDDEIIFED